MVPIFDPGNFFLLLMLFAVIGIPLSVLTVAIFFVLRFVPSRTGAMPDPPGCRNHCCRNIYVNVTSG